MSNQIHKLLSHMQVHERIRTLRLSKNYTQEYMAEKLGIDIANYGRLERGSTKITLERFEKIAEILSVSLYEIIGKVGDDLSSEKLLLEKSNQLLEDILNEIKNLKQKL